ncbi:UNVERIFIED_CONTAM: hypothetical protein FKN15_035733 [Acipenser sinensis]
MPLEGSDSQSRKREGVLLAFPLERCSWEGPGSGAETKEGDAAGGIGFSESEEEEVGRSMLCVGSILSSVIKSYKRKLKSGSDSQRFRSRKWNQGSQTGKVHSQ